ncbi:MAG TPA: PfkB family carbohydrate kinase [Bryobacteraceae bacterium]|nr:PfkB family carbohydrate kinase [Bryobacteraceae bacterium]
MDIAEILGAFSKYSVLVVGDICLDRWCTYDPATAEPSRETGIPRVGVVSTEVAPGAGGNVANNLASLGVGRAAVLGVLGDDGFAHELTRSLNARGISTDLLVRSEKVPTFTYTKLINAATGAEDLPRVDFIHAHPLPDPVEQEVLEYLREFAPSFDIIFVSDQADTRRGGVVNAAVRTLLEELCQADPGKIFWVDSRVRIERFRNMILKPNQSEADAACIGLFGKVDYQRLRAHGDSKFIFVTKGREGVVVVEESGETLVPAFPVDHPIDVSGAGDSFSAAAALALAITGSPVEAARFGNLVASIAVTKRGATVASPEEVLAAGTAHNPGN